MRGQSPRLASRRPLNLTSKSVSITALSQSFAMPTSSTLRGAVGTLTQVKKSVNEVLAEALAFFMNPYWSGLSLSKASGVAEGTIRNYLTPSKRESGKSGKQPSAKLTELEKIATAMGLQVIDLLQDLSEAEREKLYRQRAAEFYQEHGRLPPWAPKQQSAGTA